MTIVVASDLSYRTHNAMKRAFALGVELATPVHVVHIVDDSLPPAAKEAALAYAREALAAECAKVGADKAATTIVVRGGHVRTDVAAYAVEVEARLIVVGAHDSAKDGLFSFGDTTAGHIMRSSPMPVLLVTREPAGPYGQVVVGVDFSVYSKAAIRNAHRLAPSATLNLVHAYQIPHRIRLGGPAYLEQIRVEAEKAFDQFLAAEMATLVGRSVGAGVPEGAIRHRAREVMPFHVLNDAVAEAKADLVVVGTHGAGGLVRAMWGTVAGALLDAPPTDVMIVHAF
jgi:nucleotide-binding universal stress UspA family protein